MSRVRNLTNRSPHHSGWNRLHTRRDNSCAGSKDPSRWLLVLLLIVPLLILTSCSTADNGDGSVVKPTLMGSLIADVQLEESRLVATEVIHGLEALRDFTLVPEGLIWVNEVSGSLYGADPRTGEKIKMQE